MLDRQCVCISWPPKGKSPIDQSSMRIPAAALAGDSVAHYLARVPSKYVSIQSFATFLRHTGPTTLPESPPDTSRGEVLLCLHHTGGNCRNFDSLARALCDRHSPLAFDLPGHDRTASLESLASIEAMADFALEVLGAVEVDRPAVLLGHGMGGMVALQCALTAPDQVRALVLCGSSVSYDCPDDLIDRARLVSEGKARREFDITAFRKGTPPEMMRTGYMDTLKTDPRVIYPNLLAQRSWNLGERASRIPVPVLVCVGDEEKSAIALASDNLVEVLPKARKIVIPEAGHMIPLEAPEALAGAVADFLEELG